MSNHQLGTGALCFGEEAAKLIRQLKKQQASSSSALAPMGSIDCPRIPPYPAETVANIVLEMKHLTAEFLRLYSVRSDSPQLGRNRRSTHLNDTNSSSNSSSSPELRRKRPYESSSPVRNRSEDHYQHSPITTAVALSTTRTAAPTAETNSTEVTRDAGLATAILITHLAIERNKRCILAYHIHRAQLFCRIAWAPIPATPNEFPNGSSNTTAALAAAQQQTHLPPHDQRFLLEYRKLIADYKGHFLDIDIGAALVPPKDAFITVRVLRDVGQIVLSDGSVVTMMKGTQRYMKRSDVESLIRRGYLQHVD